ncbi:unnamed protein product [Arabidopsis thaliana]|uniref:Uncharacterized protein n=1 Tax=Arabidopsis thaliana TaxID=3702 RepID=Q9LTQ6_ARATH|nr:unnamed protein product [Arabidopsis thaliana]
MNMHGVKDKHKSHNMRSLSCGRHDIFSDYEHENSPYQLFENKSKILIFRMMSIDRPE